MDPIKKMQRLRRRARKGTGTIVFTRDARKGNRLNVNSFASLAVASDFRRRAALISGIKIVCVF